MSEQQRYPLGSLRFGSALQAIEFDHSLKLYLIAQPVTYQNVIDWATRLGYNQSVTYDSATDEWIIIQNGDYYIWGSVLYAADENIIIEAKLKFV